MTLDYFNAEKERCLRLARLRSPADVQAVLVRFEQKERELFAAGILSAPPPTPPRPPLWRRLLALLG